MQSVMFTVFRNSFHISPEEDIKFIECNNKIEVVNKNKYVT